MKAIIKKVAKDHGFDFKESSQNYELTATQMYDFPDVGNLIFDLARRLPKLDGNKVSQSSTHSRGCDTCGYGSAYSVYVTIQK